MDSSQERKNLLSSNGGNPSVDVHKVEGSSLASPEFTKKLKSLTRYLVQHLQLKNLPASLKLINSKKNADNPFGFTGHYDHRIKQIVLYVTDRHDTDILRSYAHEIIHHWQNERGVLHPTHKAKGEPMLNNNMPHYAQNSPWLRKREMEAFLFGNILFRDWQDEQRMGPPPQPPLLPQPYD